MERTNRACEGRTAVRGGLRRAAMRLRGLEVLHDAESWTDVVRETEEIMELALKGLLRASGVSPPRTREMSEVLLSERHRLPAVLAGEVELLAATSRRMRRDRKLAFLGAEDFTPSDFYSCEGAREAVAAARHIVELVAPQVIGHSATGMATHGSCNVTDVRPTAAATRRTWAAQP